MEQVLAAIGFRAPLDRYPSIPQFTWKEVLRFIHSRFWEYRTKKVSREQWDTTGHQLWDAVEASRGDAATVLRSVEVVPPRTGSVGHGA